MSNYKQYTLEERVNYYRDRVLELNKLLKRLEVDKYAGAYRTPEGGLINHSWLIKPCVERELQRCTRRYEKLTSESLKIESEK